ncbi:MAG: hypothetical protein ACYDHX_05415 [Methanothrix sp.]
MASEKEKTGNRPATAGSFKIEGNVQLEAGECKPGDLKLMAYAFDPVGRLLGSAEVNEKMSFTMKVDLKQPSKVELILGPPADPKIIRSSSAHSQTLQAKDWTGDGRQFSLKTEAFIPYDIWWPWRPVRICVSGHVRKVKEDGSVCPVPYVKVEVFDVDREMCWWPFIYRWWDILLDRRVVHVPEILKERVNPPRIRPEDIELAVINPQPRLRGDAVSLNPQPLPPKELQNTSTMSISEQPAAVGFTRVGEAASLPVAVASRLDSLTLTSRIAPWLVFPWCFYSKAEICETKTDCSGYFRCCFRWWPFHFRRGRLRFDSRPDVIIRVTQIIDGAETVIYMDPYTSTRWNVNNAHIDLFLDDERIRCGSGDCQDRPAGSPVFFTRIGDDEVYEISQSSGLYNEASLINVAYGGSLLIYAQFGTALGSGAPKRYYRLSYAKKTGPATPSDSAFKPIPGPIGGLSDTRVDMVTLSNESHYLGPQDVGAQSGVFEVRDFANYYWYNPDWIGTWISSVTEEDTGTYVLRLEVFDEVGNKLTTALGVDYRDGTHAPTTPPTPLPAMTDHCDLVITLDSKPPAVNLTIPAVINECGVIPWSAVPPLNFNIIVSQENGRLHSWGLQYTKGVNPAVIGLTSGSSNNGLPGTVNQIVSGNSMLVGLASTCAFALKLWAYAHVRDGRHFIYYREVIKAIAIEKCS